MEKITAGSIMTSIHNRASLVAIAQTNWGKQIRSDYKLKKQLLKIAPPNIQKWLLKNTILDDLFTFGQCSRSVDSNTDAHKKGCTDTNTAKKFKAKMIPLKEAWRNVVDIKFLHPYGAWHVKIQFTAVNRPD